MVRSKRNNLITREIPFFEYLYVLVLIIYAGLASTFVRAGTLSDSVIGYSLPIILSVLLAIKGKVKFNKQFFSLIICLFLYFIAITIKYNEIHPSVFISYSLLFFTAYITIKALKFNFFSIYEFLMFPLSIIALAMWGLQTMLRGDTLFNYLSKIPGSDLFSYVTGGGINIIIYSVQPSASSLLYGFAIPRNSGFAWEPGAFAIYLCLAILVNLFITNPSNKLNLNFWVFLIALITTQSTTGYTIFLVLIFFYLLNKTAKVVFLILPLLLIAAISVFSLPFMSNKIVGLAKETNDVDYIVQQSIGEEEGTNTQRFTSFLIAFKDFANDPILGNAGINGKSWIDKIGANISAISGIGNLLANFGIVGFLFFIITAIRTSSYLSKYNKYKGKLLLFIVILLITISYSVIFVPLIMCFWMFNLFESSPPKLVRNYHKDNLRIYK